MSYGSDESFFTTGPCPAGYYKTAIGTRSESCWKNKPSLIEQALNQGGVLPPPPPAKTGIVLALDQLLGAIKMNPLPFAVGAAGLMYLLTRKKK